MTNPERSDSGASSPKGWTGPRRDGGLLFTRDPWPLVAVAWALAVVTTYPVRSALAFGAACAGLALALR